MPDALKDVVASNINNPKEMMMQMIQYYLATKSSKEDMLPFVLKIICAEQNGITH